MSSEWRKCLLGDVVNLKRGFDLPKRERQPGRVPLISSAGASDFHNEAKVAGPGVVTGRYGTIGNVYFSKDAFWPLNTTLFVEDFKGNDPLFIYFFLKTIDYLKYSDKGAVPGVNRNHLHTAEVIIPDLPKQLEIANFLGCIDDRISILHKTNTTLEAITQALFKSWFIDFDPVYAKQNGREPEGMDSATAALFPDSFEGSESGLVPTGWKVGKFDQIARMHKVSVNPLKQPETIFEHYSLPAFDTGQMPVIEAGFEIKSNKTSVPVDSVLLSKLNPHIPRVWLPSEVDKNAVCSTEFLVFVPLDSTSKEFIYCYFTTALFQQRLCQLVTGTSNSHQRINPKAVSIMPVVIPSKDLLRTFELHTISMFDRVRHNRQQAQTLTNLRDALLPRLISGQLRLPDAEALVEDTAA